MMGAANSTAWANGMTTNYEKRPELSLLDSFLSIFRKGDGDEDDEAEAEVVSRGEGEHKLSCARVCTCTIS